MDKTIGLERADGQTDEMQEVNLRGFDQYCLRAQLLSRFYHNSIDINLIDDLWILPFLYDPYLKQ